MTLKTCEQGCLQGVKNDLHYEVMVTRKPRDKDSDREPREVLQQFMLERNWGVARLSEESGLSQPLISHILKGLRSVTPRTAKHLSLAFGNEASFWTDLQYEHNLRQEGIKRAS